MTVPLETTRLILQPLQFDDAPQVQRVFPQWDVVRYLNSIVPWPYPPDGVEKYYREVALPGIERGVEWHWTLRLKTNPHEIIGAVALMCNEKDNRGFWLAPPWRRQGLMFEACGAVTEYWFSTLRFPVLRVSKATVNLASRRISEKQGMRLIATEDRDFVCGCLPSEVWEITAEEWRACQANAAKH